MKNALFIIILGSMLAVSCKDKDQDCTAIKFKVPASVAFKGFQGDDLDTLYLRSYVKGSNFSQLIKLDTLKFAGVDIINDTAFASTTRTPLASFSNAVDYEMTIPTLSRTFRITDLKYSTDTIVRWTATDCSTQASFPLPPIEATVDGVATPTIEIAGTSRWIILSN